MGCGSSLAAPHQPSPPPPPRRQSVHPKEDDGYKKDELPSMLPVESTNLHHHQPTNTTTNNNGNDNAISTTTNNALTMGTTQNNSGEPPTVNLSDSHSSPVVRVENPKGSQPVSPKGDSSTLGDAFMETVQSPEGQTPQGSTSPAHKSGLITGGRSESMFFKNIGTRAMSVVGDALILDPVRSNNAHSFSLQAKRKSKAFFFDKVNIARSYSFGALTGKPATLFERIAEIGKGPLCVTYMGKDPEGEQFVCRSILTGSVPFLASNPSITETLLADLEICSFLNNKNIQPIQTVLEVKSDEISQLPHINIFGEFYYECATDNTIGYSSKRLRLLLKDVLTGLGFLYSNKQPHRHLTRSNVFYKDISDTGGPSYIVGDIGMGHLFKSLTLEQLIQLDHTDVALFPPEIIRGEYNGTLEDDAACDLWAVGILMLTVASGTSPFPAPGDVKTSINARTRWFEDIAKTHIAADKFANLDTELRPIVQQLLHTDPTVRGKFDTLLRSPCLREKVTVPQLSPNLLGTTEVSYVREDDEELAIPTAISTTFKQSTATIRDQIVCSSCGKKEGHMMISVCEECLNDEKPYIVCQVCMGAGNYEHDPIHLLTQSAVKRVEVGDKVGYMIIPIDNLTKHEQTFFTTFRQLPSTLAFGRKGLSLTHHAKENSVALTPSYSVCRLDRTTTGTFRGVGGLNLNHEECDSNTADSDCDSPQAGADRNEMLNGGLMQCPESQETPEEIIEECINNPDRYELMLADMGLTTVPQAIFDAPILHVTILCLCDNKLTTLGSGIQHLISLRKLLLGNNLLTELPETIGNLSDLDELDANHNALTTLPQSLMFCEMLELVTIDYNQFTEIPSVIFDLPSLKSLFLAANPITKWASDDLLCMLPHNLQLGLDNEPSLYRYYKEHIALHPNIHLNIAWNRIYPDSVGANLYCGSLRSAQTISVYEQLNIGYVLTMGRGLEPVIPDGMHHKTIIVDDIPNAKIDVSFDDAVAFIDEAMQAGKGCLVHCFAGLSRSATAVIAYLMVKQGMRLDDAYMLTKKGRPNIYPNDGFLKQLMAYDEQLFIGQRKLNLELLQRGVIPT